MNESPLPYITPDLPGVGGELKRSPCDFVVEEVALYEPTDAGEHLYVRLTREGSTTRDLVERLCKLFALPEVDVGYAGLKDKQARATQTFSLRLPQGEPAEHARRIADGLPVEVAWARRHVNKLRKGHLRGNRFTILVRAPHPDAASRASAIAEALRASGLPNFYGAQRFGGDGDNVRRGREALEGRGPRAHWLRNLLLSAWQSALFNDWLAERIRRQGFARLWTGDIAKKTDTGGIFEVADADVEQPRFDRREITLTGPIYGSRMRWASGPAGELEQALLAREAATVEMLRRARLDGTRRAARLFLDGVAVEPAAEGLQFTFTLPKGAYATTLLREFMKADADLGEEAADGEA